MSSPSIEQAKQWNKVAAAVQACHLSSFEASILQPLAQTEKKAEKPSEITAAISEPTEKQELSTQQLHDQLALLRNELTNLKAAKMETEEKHRAEKNHLENGLEKLDQMHKKSTLEVNEHLVRLMNALTRFMSTMDAALVKQQAENNALKEALKNLKKKHEETLSKLEVAEDIAQRDHALEQKLVLLAEAMLSAKQVNEASLKDLKKRVKKIDNELESDQSKLREESKRNGKKAGGASDPSMEGIAGIKEQLEAKNVEIKKLQKTLRDKAEELSTMRSAFKTFAAFFCLFYFVIILPRYF